jgi:hypothetical protein
MKADNRRSPKYVEVPDVDEVDMTDMIYPVKPQRQSRIKKANVRKSRSCCCVCAYITLALIALFFILCGLIFMLMYSMIAKEVKLFTVETPVDFPIQPIPDAELEVFKDKSKLFFDMIVNDEIPDYSKLVISADVLNGFIAHSDFLRGHAFVKMMNDKVVFETSLPTDSLPGGEHRYFVSSDTIEASKVNGSESKKRDADDVTTKIITKFELGKEIPNVDGPLFIAEFLAHLNNLDDKKVNVNIEYGKVFGYDIVSPEDIAQKKNILDDLYEDPNTAKILNGIESITIEDNQIIINARGTAKLSGASVMISSSEQMVDEIAPIEATVTHDVTMWKGGSLRGRVLD